MKKNIIYGLAAAAVFCVIAASILIKKGFILTRPPESLTYTRTLMGTTVELTLWDNGADLDQAAEAGFTEIKRLEHVLSSYDPDSDASRVTSNAGNPVRVSHEMLGVTTAAVDAAVSSCGAFDPTVGALARLWGYSGEKGTVPSAKDVKKLLPLVDYTKITIDGAMQTIMLGKKDMSLNLGGVAKGYIVGRTAEVLKTRGVRRAIVKAGGDMFVFQDKRDRRPFIIGIQHPREKRLLGEVYVDEGAVSSSGDYERFFTKGGVRYHHILDPATGFPADKSIAVTIVAKDPARADALSTAVFVMGPKEGMQLIEALDGVEGVIVDAKGKVHASKGFKGKIF
ncbi:MAG: FAD:protein FMN transferase [Deltaproteobacteria bacterium]|nr:FAD:protein FMN transferase [Deltaproteobacteria bacterium]